MDKILVSACLLGENTRYDGKNNEVAIMEALNRKFDLVPFCPEVQGGLPTPRLPSEIRGSQVYAEDGTNVTSSFQKGAEKAWNICQFLGIHIAILKENSPSCGVHKVHNGLFNGNLVDGEGFTTRYLRAHGVTVMNEEEAIVWLQRINEGERIKDAKTAQKKEEEQAKRDGTYVEPVIEEKREFKPRRKPRFDSDKPRPKSGYERRRAETEEKRVYGKKHSFGDKKPYGEKRSYGDKKPYGEKRSYGDKKSFGKKPFGKKPYGKKPSFSKPRFKKNDDK